MPAADDPLTFPDLPRAALDQALDEVVTRAREVLATQGRLRALLRASQAVVEELELPVVLRRIVDAAVELVGAQYGALGVIAPQGGLEQFIYIGMTPKQAVEIGHLPEGHGLLGALIDDPHAIRLEHLSHDPRSAGFPATHPAMESFLGVPVRIKDEIFGNLYLTNQASGRFSEEDEQLVSWLAATAGFAINNARLYAETRRRQAWSAASAEVTAALLTEDEKDPVGVVAERVLDLASASQVRVLFPTEDPDQLEIGVARGDESAGLVGHRVSTVGSISGTVMEARQPQLIDPGQTDDLGVKLAFHSHPGPIAAVPLIAGGSSQGVMIVIRKDGDPRFTTADLEMISDFAGQTSVAMELGSARADRQRAALFEDRTRIARDLHDHVIQQLFGAGMELQSVAGRLGAGEASERIARTVDTLDSAIAQIRTVIFALSSPRGSTSVRHQLVDLVTDAGTSLAHTPTLVFSGPIDVIVAGGLADDLVAVTREALTNVVKHARATTAEVSVTAGDGRLSVTIADDGVGIPQTGRRSGLANLRRRAEDRGGTFVIDSTDRGTRLTWEVPY